MPFQNVSLERGQSALPSTTGGQAARNESKQKVGTPDTVPTRATPGLTRYNTESGLVEPRSTPWQAARTAEVEPAQEGQPAVDKPADKPELSRQEAFRAQQADKRARTEAARQQKATEGQQTARAALEKGDLVSAAKALGVSPSDLILMVNNGALGIKTEPAKLSPEEQRSADEKALRDKVAALEKDQHTYVYRQKAQEFIREHITPALADRDRFECIHQQNVREVEATAYEFMNRHFGETGVVLKAEDVLETIEEELAKTVLAGVERARSLKKAARYFGAPQAPQSQQLQGGPGRQSEPRDVHATSTPYGAREDEELSDLMQDAVAKASTAREAEPIGRGFSDSAAPRQPSQWAFLSRKEKLARIREEDEAAERAARR